MVEVTRQGARIDCMKGYCLFVLYLRVGVNMSLNVEKRYQDIAFFNIEQKAPPPKKANLACVVLITVSVTVMLLGIGFVIGKKAGVLPQSCCFGALALDFDFDFGR